MKAIIIVIALIAGIALVSSAHKIRKKDYKDLRYKVTRGVDKKYQTLDWYYTSGKSKAYSRRRGVVIYIHGGNWRAGDKGDHIRDKVKYFRDRRGYNFVSINYRLMTKNCKKKVGLIKKRTVPCKFPDNAHDVAGAISYVLDNALKYGANPTSVSLIGHGAGAHLAALVSTDKKYLAAYNRYLENINFVALLDTDAFRLSYRLRDADSMVRAFGHSKQVWWDASPINFIHSKQRKCQVPPQLLLYSGKPKRRESMNAYVEKLKKSGCTVETYNAEGYSRSKLINAIGKINRFSYKIFEMLVNYNV